MKYRMWDVVQLLWLVIIGVYKSGYIHGMVTMSMHVGYGLSLTMQMHVARLHIHLSNHNMGRESFRKEGGCSWWCR